MVIRLLSLVVTVCISELTFIGAQAPNDPLFLFISNNRTVVIARLILIMLALNISFKGRFRHIASQRASALLGTSLIIFGVAASVSQTVFDKLGSYLKLFDLVFIIEIGIILSLAAITYRASKRKFSLTSTFLYRLLYKSSDLNLEHYSRKQKSAF